MTLVASGELGMRSINAELGRTTSAQISLDTAENGGYGAINQNSRSRPSSANPAAISEWYSYDHSAGGPSTAVLYRMGFTTRSGQTGANFACAGGFERTIWHEPAYPAQNWFSSDSLIYANAELTEFAEPGTYSDQPFAGGFSARYWDGSRMDSEGYLCEI